MVSEAVSIPLIAHGGAASVSHVRDAVSQAGADAVSVASMLHYAALNRNSSLLDKFEDEGNIEFLKKNSSFKIFGSENLTDVKIEQVDGIGDRKQEEVLEV